MDGLDVAVTEKTVFSSDGTEIGYYVAGNGPRQWLLAPAMGAPVLAMKHIFERFHRDYTIVSWDMRGFHHSGPPPHRDAYAIDDHLADLAAVRDAEGMSSFVLGGWSMGVQLSLEYYRRRPSDVRALVLINGPFEQALDPVLPAPCMAPALLFTLGLARHLSPGMNLVSRRLLNLTMVTLGLELGGLLAQRSDHFLAVLDQFRQVDWGRYFTVMGKLHEHSAAAHLGEVDVPTLITAGGRDRMAPVAIAEELHRAIAGSELLVIPEGTHYTPIEFGEALVDRIECFLRDAIA
jgi:pimeloyl-ACP methyl ester carboxylesterase